MKWKNENNIKEIHKKQNKRIKTKHPHNKATPESFRNNKTRHIK